MKFQTFGTDDIFKPGRLHSLLEQIEEGIPASKCSRMDVDQLSQIPSIYARLEPDVFIPTIDDEELIKTGNDKEITGLDLKSITKLMYERPRSAYCNFKNEKQMRSNVSGAVPLGLLGFKRFRNIDYDWWRKQVSKHITYRIKNDQVEFKLTDDAIKEIFKVDLLLGKTLSSTYYERAEDTIKLNLEHNWGLILLSQLTDEKFRPNANDVRFLRKNIGNFKSHFATTYGTAAIRDNDLPGNINKLVVNIHNSCDTPMRLMLSQRWAWYGMHRTSDAICDFQDWDNIPKNLDNMAAGFVGTAPLAAEGGNLGQAGKGVFGV